MYDTKTKSKPSLAIDKVFEPVVYLFVDIKESHLSTDIVAIDHHIRAYHVAKLETSRISMMHKDTQMDFSRKQVKS